MSFHRLLIANRGEIAVRIIRSAKAAGLHTIAVYSDADRDALFVTQADEAIRIGPGPAGESYLSISAIIAAAKATGAEAVHPGYGFLSENAAFAQACVDAGLIFVGPHANVIALMGNKAQAKAQLSQAGVPTIPGYQGLTQDDAGLELEAGRVGYPLMIKAAAGGGGRGMRRIDRAEDFRAGVGRARSEAQAAFGSGELILERAIDSARHIEIQIAADQAGNCVHLFERDCTAQRRYQKVIEEAPSPVVGAQLRAAIGRVAALAAKTVGYQGVGTLEFLADADGGVYFLEMNTRIQVEHPVTELVTGIDLVELQLAIAMGRPLPFTQEDLSLQGHAMEARLYAEDPASGFLPQSGPVLVFEPPTGTGIRVDHGLTAPSQITTYYDPMIAKIIAYGPHRDGARRRLIAALRDTVVFGIRTNKEFLISLLEHEDFAAAKISTEWIGRNFTQSRAPAPPEAVILAALIFAGGGQGAWSSTGERVTPFHFDADGAHFSPLLFVRRDGIAVTLDAKDYAIGNLVLADGKIQVSVAGQELRARFLIEGQVLHLDWNGRVFRTEDQTYAPASRSARGGDGRVRAPMSGRVVSVSVSPGGRVAAGDVLLVLEAMKMEHRLTAPCTGQIAAVAVSAGGQVNARDILIEITEEKP